MNAPHLHLLLNHVPTIGTVIAFGLLLLAFIRKDEGLKRVSLEVFFVIALLTLPAYLSGVGTQVALEQREGVSLELMTRHHDAALFASLLMLLSGGFAWLALWQWRRLARARNGTLALVLLFAVLTLTAMARTATAGGEIRHPEILIDPEAVQPAVPAWLTAGDVAQFVSGQTWAWPAAEALHFIGLWLLFGIVLMVNLRLLGLMKGIPFAAVHRLLPWAALGLGVNAITGMGFVIAAPGQYVENIAFFWKIGLLLLAGLNLLYITIFDGPWKVGAGQDAPLIQKAMAAVTIALWVGVMYYGRMLPFLGNAF